MVTHVIASSRSSALNEVDGGWTGDLPLSVLLTDEVMQAALRSAGLTAAAFRLEFQTPPNFAGGGEVRIPIPEFSMPAPPSAWRRHLL